MAQFWPEREIKLGMSNDMPVLVQLAQHMYIAEEDQTRAVEGWGSSHSVDHQSPL